MRLSALVIVSILLLSSTLIAQRTSSSGSSASSGGSSSSGASHSSYSGGSSSSASSASSHNSSSSASSANSHNSSSSSSHVASTGAASSRSLPSFKVASTRETAAPEKRSTRTFWHPFRKAQPVRAEFRHPPRCLKQPCAVCPAGGSRKGGACVVASNVCPAGQSWNGISCGAQYWFRDCSDLARQLEAQRRQMRGQNDPGQSLFYQILQRQYESCMARFGLAPFGSFALNDTRLEDVIP